MAVYIYIYRLENWNPEFSLLVKYKHMLQVLMAFRMYVELNKHISYRPIKKEKKKITNPVSRRLRSTALAVSTVLYLCMNIHTDDDVSRFKYKF